jgi:hypothetical protein
MSLKLAEVGGKLLVGGGALVAGWGTKKVINLWKEAGHDVPEWVEELGPGAISLGFGLLGGRVGRPTTPSAPEPGV